MIKIYRQRYIDYRIIDIDVMIDIDYAALHGLHFLQTSSI